MNKDFTTKERKRAFDIVYKSKVLPFFESEGFKQVTKTSKRLFKELKDGLTVYIYFEFNNFGSGFYELNVAYYDAEIGSEEEGIYLAMALIKKPTFAPKNAEEMNGLVEGWLNSIKSTVFHFIDHHDNHKAILDSDQFYYAHNIQQKCKELLARKAGL